MIMDLPHTFFLFLTILLKFTLRAIALYENFFSCYKTDFHLQGYIYKTLFIYIIYLCIYIKQCIYYVYIQSVSREQSFCICSNVPHKTRFNLCILYLKIYPYRVHRLSKAFLLLAFQKAAALYICVCCVCVYTYIYIYITKCITQILQVLSQFLWVISFLKVFHQSYLFHFLKEVYYCCLQSNVKLQNSGSLPHRINHHTVSFMHNTVWHLYY